MNTRFGWAYPAFVLAAVGVVGGRQLVQQWRLRREIDSTRQAAAQVARMERENERLRASADTQPDAAADIDRLRGEVARLQREREERRAPSASAPAERFGPGAKIAAAEWRNVGRDTPRAALETTLWAGAGGDVDAFARGLFIFPDGTRKLAEALLQSLPPAEQARYGTPERLLAALTIPDVPLGSFEVRNWRQGDWSPALTAMDAVDGIVADPAGKVRAVHLIFGRTDQGWKLVVTPGVIAKYAEQLKATAPKP